MELNEEFLARADKGINSAKGFLAKIFRQMLLDYNVSPREFNMRLNRYIKNPANNIPDTPRLRSSVRGNLSKELRKNKMTWSNFIKALNFLAPVKATVIMQFKLPNGELSVSEVVVIDKGLGIKNGSGWKTTLKDISKTILKDAGIEDVSNSEFNLLLNKYLDSPSNRVNKDSKIRSHTRSNMKKEFSKDTMTWNNLEKLIRVINPTEICFIVNMQHHANRKSSHRVTFTLE